MGTYLVACYVLYSVKGELILVDFSIHRAPTLKEIGYFDLCFLLEDL